MKNSIGIVGGVGPYAGIALQQAILRSTRANSDQDYPPVLSISAPHAISDRTEFLLGNTSVNPAYEIINQIKTLYATGARYIGIPCNTAHANPIFSVIKSGINDLKDMFLVNMVDETFKTIKDKNPDSGKVGVLATKGSYKSELFPSYGLNHKYEVIIPEDEQLQDAVHRSIYDDEYGIKVLGYLHEHAREHLDSAFNFYKELNITIVILGCTELSVVFNGESYREITLVNPITALAKKLIKIQQDNYRL